MHKRNKFTPEEDKKLIELVKEYGTDNWYLISKNYQEENQDNVETVGHFI